MVSVCSLLTEEREVVLIIGRSGRRRIFPQKVLEDCDLRLLENFHRGFHFLHRLLSHAGGAFSSFFDYFLRLFRVLNDCGPFVPHRLVAFHHGVGNLALAIDASNGSGAAILVNLFDDVG